MSHVLFRTTGGEVCLPDSRTIMIDRADGGQLVVYPPRKVWERTALNPSELTRWTFLVASTGRAMLECLPQLEGGCLNYWDAGNWALHHEAAPAGPKTGLAHRFLHQHVIGRSPRAADPSWQWGEAPTYPAFRDRFAWSARKAPLTPKECVAVVSRLEDVLHSVYDVNPDECEPWTACAACGYPTPAAGVAGTPGVCSACGNRVRA